MLFDALSTLPVAHCGLRPSDISVALWVYKKCAMIRKALALRGPVAIEAESP
jgi:hypothetical protein